MLGYVVVFTVTAYVTRGLMLLLGAPKRAMIERAEELGNQDEAELTNLSSATLTPSEAQSTIPLLSQTPEDDIQIPLRAQDPDAITGTGGPPEADLYHPTVIHQPNVLRQNPLPLTRAQRWAAWLNVYFDWIVYGLIFALIGLPVYYAADYAMPAQLSLTVLAYLTALTVSPRWRRYVHPVMVSAPIIMIVVYIMALVHGQTFGDGLRAYKTGTNYLKLFRGESDPRPGAGDFLSSVLDVSIISLALPMFQYRDEMKRSVCVPAISLQQI